MNWKMSLEGGFLDFLQFGPPYGNIYQFIGFNWCDILMPNVDILPNILLVSKIIPTQMAIFATHVSIFAQMWS